MTRQKIVTDINVIICICQWSEDTHILTNKNCLICATNLNGGSGDILVLWSHHHLSVGAAVSYVPASRVSQGLYCIHLKNKRTSHITSHQK